MKDVLATPNEQHTASGAPGYKYTQQKVDYIMNIRLEESTNTIYGDEKITYHNNSQDNLEYLWVQLDQNIRTKDSKALLKNGSEVPLAEQPDAFAGKYMSEPFDGGFVIEEVKDAAGKPLSHTINFTMMRINLPQPLKSKDKISFSIKWNFNIVDHTVDRARSGYEEFADGHRAYVIAQFFPRMAVA